MAVAIAAIMVSPGTIAATSAVAHNLLSPHVAARGVGPSTGVGGATSLGHRPVAGMPDAGAAQLQAAEATLRQGAGPADGRSLDCVSSGASTATTCSNRTTGRATPTGPAVALDPAAAALALGSNLAWEVQGVPQPVGYVQFAMTWDYWDNYVVLFGGSTESYNGDNYGGDTWIYQSGVWTQLYPLVSPEGRDSSGLAYSPWDDAVMLFGGYYPGTGGYLNDTWLFKAGSWTQMHVNAPSPRNGFGLVYDPAVDADVLFGGRSPGCPQGVCNDTWEYHFDAWTRVTTNVSPPPRWQMSMAYDSQDGDVIMFGGLGVGTACPSSGPCGDTWQFNASAGWVQVPTNVLCGTTAEGPCPAADAPSPRHEASMAYDYVHGYILLFGGWNLTTNEMGDTWEYSAGTWTELSPSASPTGRNGAALAFDYSPSYGYLVLVGGTPTAYTSPDAIFAWTGSSWVRTAPAANVNPGPTEGGSMAYDAADGYVVFFGGYNSTFAFSTATWTYSHGVWTRLSIAGPPLDYDAAMAFDPAQGYVLMFGGANLANATWAFHAGAWTELCGEICAFGSYAPPPRYGAGLAYDPGSQFMILFGGEAYEHGVFRTVSETWAWVPVSATSGSWENYTSFLGSTVPAARAFPGMTYDADDNELVLYGGGTGSAVYGDTWTMTDLFFGWKQVGTCGGPSQSTCTNGPDPSAAMVFDYDSVTQAVVMSAGAGGNAFSGYLNTGTYLFRAGTWTQCTSSSCQAYLFGWGTFNGWGASAFDAADGYTLTSGGEGWYDNYALGVGTYYQNPYSWVFGTPLYSQGPGFSPEQADVGQSVTFSVGSTGGGSGAYSYSWSGLPTGCVPSSPTVESFTCVMQDNGFTQYGGTNKTPDSYFDPSVEVADSSGSPSWASPDSANWLGWLYVAPDPWVTIDSTTTVADVGQTVYFGLNVSYGFEPYNETWNDLPSGCVANRTSPTSEREKCVLTSADIGDWYPQAEVVDGVGYAALSRVLQLTVDAAAATTPVSSTVASLDAGQTLSVWVTPSGGDGSYSYAWTGVPAACLSNAPVLSCAVPASEVGDYAPSVTVTDGVGSSIVGSYPGTIVVHPAPTATALAVTNASDDPAEATDAGLAVTFTLTSAPGSGSDTVSWTALPAGCSPATTNSTVVTCSPVGVGSFSVTATVTDSNGVSATSPVALLTVAPALTGGTVSASTHSLDVGQELTVAGSFLGGGGALAYAWSGLPSGCVASDAATVTCSPSGPGRYSPSVSVTDANGGHGSATIASTVVVSADPSATALEVVDSAAAPVGTVTTGSLVTFELTASPGAGTNTVTWSGLPAGCSPPSSNATSVACRPNATGTYTVSATELDANGLSATSPVASLVVTSPPTATPFATPVQETGLGMLAALIALGAVAVVLALRRPPSPKSSPPSGPPPKPAPAPAGAPSWKET
jgi:hypothetical protein